MCGAILPRQSGPPVELMLMTRRRDRTAVYPPGYDWTDRYPAIANLLPSIAVSATRPILTTTAVLRHFGQQWTSSGSEAALVSNLIVRHI